MSFQKKSTLKCQQNFCNLAAGRKKKLQSNQNWTYFGVALRLAAWALSEFDYVDSIFEALVEFHDDSLKDIDPTRCL